MASFAEPLRPNIASADVQLPGVRDYEQVDNDIIGTLKPTAGWFAAFGVAGGARAMTQDLVARVFAEGRRAHPQVAPRIERLVTARVDRLTEDMRELSAEWDRAPLVTALQAMRGIEMVSAVTLAAEVGDFRRFAKASDFMSFVGLVPSESSSGQTRRRGPITRAGNGHVRRILVEAAQHYSRPPRLSKQVRARGERASAAVRVATKQQVAARMRAQEKRTNAGSAPPWASAMAPKAGGAAMSPRKWRMNTACA